MAVEDSAVQKLKVRCPCCNQKLDLSGLQPFTLVACPTCEFEFQVPQHFACYVLEERIGVNQVACVYRALDLKLERQVCVKILNRTPAQIPEVVELFTKFNHRIALFNHPNILPVYSSGTEERQPFSVHEYMPGKSLGAFLRQEKGGLSSHDALEVLKQILRGLMLALEHDIVHGGLTPNNILFGAEGVVKVADFGMRSLRLACEGDAEGQGTRQVSSCFLSPELAETKTCSWRGDVYSLGALLYFMLTGVMPAARRDEETVAQQLIRTRRDVSESVVQLIVSLMAKEPEKRPEYREIMAEIVRLSDQLDSQQRNGARLKLSREVNKRNQGINIDRNEVMKKNKVSNLRKLLKKHR